MAKTILITGSTDGIGLETAKRLVDLGHRVLIHGRSEERLADTKSLLAESGLSESIESYRADLSDIAEVEALAAGVLERYRELDVLINNAGVFKASQPMTEYGFDLRFIVNAVAPYLLTIRLLPLMSSQGRVVNVSSAAQAPVDLDALGGKVSMDDYEAYAQSKLAMTMWSVQLARQLGDSGPAIFTVNPGSLLGSKMVREAFGIEGKDIQIGADILVRAACGDEFADASGRYFDNDNDRFASPPPDALDPGKTGRLVNAMEALLSGSEA